MTISTPRLCSDLAFQPPKAAKPHAVTCHPIFSPRSERKQLEAKEEVPETMSKKKSPIIKTPAEILEMLQMTSKDADKDDPTMQEIWGDAAAKDSESSSKEAKDVGGTKKKRIKVADIEIGGYNILPPGTKLEKGAVVGGGPEKYIGTIAKSDGYVASDQELAKMKVEKIQDFEMIRDEVMNQADGAEWHIDLVHTARGTEMRAFIGGYDLAKDDDGDGEDSEEREYEEWGVDIDFDSDEEMREEL
jgi:protein OS-9